MVRAAASPKNREFAVVFSQTVTEKTCGASPASSIVGRSGDNSLFEVFGQCFPSAVRTHSRNGVTLIEFNKELERAEFLRVRHRNTMQKIVDDAEKSTYFWGARRWRDPDNAEDLAHLQYLWKSFNHYQSDNATFNKICDILRHTIAVEECRPKPRVISKRQAGLKDSIPCSPTSPISRDASYSIASACTTPCMSRASSACFTATPPISRETSTLADAALHAMQSEFDSGLEEAVNKLNLSFPPPSNFVVSPSHAAASSSTFVSPPPAHAPAFNLGPLAWDQEAWSNAQHACPSKYLISQPPSANPLPCQPPAPSTWTYTDTSQTWWLKEEVYEPEPSAEHVFFVSDEPQDLHLDDVISCDDGLSHQDLETFISGVGSPALKI